MRFGVWGFGIWGLGFRFGVWGWGFGVWGLRFTVYGLRCTAYGLGLGFGVWGLGALGSSEFGVSQFKSQLMLALWGAAFKGAAGL